ncbi:MAG: hypothetical protein KGL93_01270 [Gemmatimonadota bacterium]|nr:hypothetical protein [Gemmatimonadota bacterium]HEU4988389.1 hypothetical protein [Gemmatimonadaceae bacterium]
MRTLPRLALAAALAAAGAVRAAAQTPVATPLKFSGVIYADWQNGGTKAQRALNKFDLTRAYLNFIMPAGDNVTVRVTTDVLNNTAPGTYYKGWTARIKYAFMEWAAWKDTGTDPAALTFRFGLEQTPEIDMMESFWQRGITNTPIDYLGFVPSSDLGATAIVTLPGKQGQIYGGVYNGSGYGAVETDRFKNVNVRFSWTPLAGSKDAGYLKGLQISPYYQKGYTASNFNATGPGLQQDLWGVHVGIKDPRLTVVGEYDSRTNGADTPTNATVTTTTGAVYSAFAIVRPLAYLNGTKTNPWSLVVRGDQYKPDNSKSGYQRYLIGGVGYDINSKVTAYADYQDVEGHNFATTAPSDIKAFFVHFVIGF